MNMKMDKIFHFKKILNNKILKSSFWLIEKKLIQRHRNIVAIDEAGRGALAGPLSIGAIYLDKSALKILEKNKIKFYDSKMLTPKKRQEYRKIIKKLGLKFKVVLISNKKIDKIGINNAFIYGVKKILAYFQPNSVVFDGRKLKEFDQKNFYFFVKGDKFLPSLGAASILAKTKRDEFMINLSKKIPEYLFEIHKGYGTKKHFQLIKKYGISKYHRKSFLNFYF